MRIPLHLLPLCVTALLSAATTAGENFTSGILTEVVNEVAIVKGLDATVTPAEINARIAMPDAVKTGRKSRAQITLTDGTIVRVSANAVFSFDKDSRTARLKQGSLLFSTPKGAGGGKVISGAATCSVIGTTVIVTAKPGKTECLLLEGTGRLDHNGKADGGIIPPFHVGTASDNPNIPVSFRPASSDDELLIGEMTVNFTATLPAQSLINVQSSIHENRTRAGSSASRATEKIPDLTQVTVISPNHE